MILVLLLLLSLLYLKGLGKTVFGVDFGRANYLGFFVFYDLVIYIIPSIILLNTIPIENFWVAFKVKQVSVWWISLLAISSMFLFYLTLIFISKTSNKYFMLGDLQKTFNNNGRLFVRLSLLVSVLAIILIWVFIGVGHSFTLSFMDEVSISTLRSEITANKSVKALKHLFIFISPFLTAIVGSNLYDKHKFERYIMLLLILFVASWGGSKGPLLSVLIVYFVTKATFNKMKISLKVVFKFLLLIFVLLYLTYRVVLFQYPQMVDASLFFNYFSQRVFVAQMIGTYEQFNLFIHDLKYIWHGVPFASSFIDFPIFHKDLMLISEDRIDPSSIGIKNTLFISEAYGMGGWFLLFLSPFWIAVTFSLNYRWMLFVANKFIFKNLEFSKRIVAIAIFSYVSVTGGFSDLMFFKITIMMTLLLLPFITLNYIISRLKI